MITYDRKLLDVDIHCSWRDCLLLLLVHAVVLLKLKMVLLVTSEFLLLGQDKGGVPSTAENLLIPPPGRIPPNQIFIHPLPKVNPPTK